ncbi:uncharacterized protein LOC129939416 isoform X2 [Eupeodes corollae]|uniref:uncharacterized protein LOC129939416 isoform X2 n=1 Tax=Eupeodes corollae TaxID=290404 RepID=UPI00248F821F|nr:uncharacterized protein LOC129939416 isoform X2 [Eupeodes corollae]
MRSQYIWNNKYHIIYVLIIAATLNKINAKKPELTSCQHLQKAETRRARALSPLNKTVRVPRCTKLGEFEPIQCTNDELGTNCWCVDEYGFEIPGTRNQTRQSVQCAEPKNCSVSNCRMFCESGFERDARSGCSVCRCRNPCDGLECPNGEVCQIQEVKCKNEPCPPIPTCKKGRSIENYCPAGFPLSIEGSVRPFLCGLEPGKPVCPPMYKCIVESGNDYGVCCPNHSLNFKKPGTCPADDSSPYTEKTGYMCGTPCSHDLECKQMEKCCHTKGCKMSCQQPVNITNCHQLKVLADLMTVNEREGRGYVPDCNGPGGTFSPKQCSRNGLVCWCVDPRTGNKLKGTMGAASKVNCDGWENIISRSFGRSFSSNDCDYNICAAVCEYGFKNDHNGCPTCECSEPCEGFKCPGGSHCEVATDPLCESGSALCSSWPVCKPDFVYSNPCEVDSPLQDNVTGEIFYCSEERQSRALEPVLFYDDEPLVSETRSISNRIVCPVEYKCTKLHGQSQHVCCPDPFLRPPEIGAEIEPRQQTMCEYLRDFSKRMEGTEKGMQLAIAPPVCTNEGNFRERQCALRKVMVTRSEHRKILEENTIRKMRMLLEGRSKRDVESLKLYRVDDSLLNVQVASEPSSAVSGRSAKLIESSDENDLFPQLFKANTRKGSSSRSKAKESEDILIPIEVEECWCVDGFGTEIPDSRGPNVTDEYCINLRESIDCLELTCRMGCDYGFDLDPTTKCPACHCRDPCDGISCTDDTECRIIDVSCDDEYCPPVPACLPRKPGQCPFLVPPGSDRQTDGNYCSYECRTDSQCDGSRRCCSNGCGTQCVEPQMKTACQHLHAIQMHQFSEIGIPAKQMHVAMCDEQTGKWKEIQCGPENICWCVDEIGQEIGGTRSKNSTPICKPNSAFKCPSVECPPCEYGHKVDENGCIVCQCRDLCEEITCSSNEACELINVECVDRPCPKMPICVPLRDSVCPEGSPLKQNNVELSCGPHNENDVCPSTHTCQLNPVSHRGVCCSKTRDVCFESIDSTCKATEKSLSNVTYYRFNPKANKCVPILLDMSQTSCQTKNIFRNEQACVSVCPVLTPCERLKLKNNLAAKRARQAVWFEPRCDPITGHWSPVQCLGNQMLEEPPVYIQGTNSLSDPKKNTKSSPGSYGVCWCADKKGAPLKGTLTRDLEPICNSRQARRQSHTSMNDPLMEHLIERMTMLVTEEIVKAEETDDEDEDEDDFTYPVETIARSSLSASGSDNVYESVNSIMDSKLSVENMPKLTDTTRCFGIAKTASFPVECDEKGSFLPTQCNRNKCWCVDEAGNQIPQTSTFQRGTRKCMFTAIESVAIEIFLHNVSSTSVKNFYDIVKMELHQYIGDPINLRVQENIDGTAIVSFELHDADKINKAYLIENAIENKKLFLGRGHYEPDITLSKFVHRNHQIPVAQTFTSPESTIQVAVFILATSSAFLVSLFVVYVMLKRGRHDKYRQGNYSLETDSDSFNSERKIDFGAPIFVLSVEDSKDTK